MKKVLKKEIAKGIKDSLQVINDSFKKGKKVSYKERGTKLHNSAMYLLHNGNLRVQRDVLPLTVYPEHYGILLSELNKSVQLMLKNSKIED